MASHHTRAEGMRDTVCFLSGACEIYAISAYMDETKLEDQIQDVFSNFDATDEIFIFTDMLGGSVNQTFYPYMKEQVHLLCGMNLPLVLAVALAPETHMTKAALTELLSQAQQQIIYINDYEAASAADDE